MKPLPIIISIVLLTFSIVRLANSCEKREKRAKANEFYQQRQTIDRLRQAVLSYDRNDADSIDWMAARNELFEESLDSSIKYYRDNYFSDEKRHKAYLNTLYAYKKMSYVYADLIKHNREYAAAKKKDTTKHRYKYTEYISKSRSLYFDLNRVNIDLMSDF